MELSKKYFQLDLLKKIKYHFANQNELGNFTNYPKYEKIVYIGGILVEEKGLLNKNKIEKNESDDECVVLLSFGTHVNFALKDRANVEEMFKIFSKFEECKFIVRINKNIVPQNYSENIQIIDSNQLLNQQEILAKENTLLMISHCGQNSLIEALYAGVPLICIPFNGDQPYNSAIVENLGIGIWVEREKIGEEIKDALFKILKTKTYSDAVWELRSKIHALPPKKKIFLDRIEEVMNED